MGRPLQSDGVALEEGELMPIDDVLRMAGHCQRADYARSQGIIHRDINRQCVDRKD